MTLSNAPEPEAPIVLGPREQLFHLLAEAAEIEHTLMCTYLYAAFSLKRECSTFSAAEADAVRRWRKEIVGVATEEMVHLLLVANLTIALGARPHFGRPNFPVAPGYFPSGVVVKLSPFNLATLDHFVFLERPRGVQQADGAGFESATDYERREAHYGLMPSIQDYNTIGRLYDALRVNVNACASRLGERELFRGDARSQIGKASVALEGVRVIDSLATALAAIDTIVDQGEGSNHDREDSHYQRFVRMREEYLALREANPDFEPAWPAAESPVMRTPVDEGAPTVFIDHPTAARVLDFANAIYGLLLRFLIQAFGRQSRSPEETQRRYVGAAIELMQVLGGLASILVTLPASPSRPDVNAGLSFTMLRGAEPLLEGPAEERLLKERLDELVAGAHALHRHEPRVGDLHGKLAALSANISTAGPS